MIACVLSVVLGVSAAAWAGGDPPEPPTDEQTQPGDDGLGDLDVLLGIDDEAKDSDAIELPDPSSRALDRKLSAKEAVEQFMRAVVLMDEVADRIESARDTGLATQRLQEDILRKLEIMIESSSQQQSKSSGSSSSSSQSGQQQDQPNQPTSSSQQSGGSENTGQRNPPAARDASLGPNSASATAAWGALPTRLRDALLQGSTDRFSTLYESLTEAYYKRLADEAGRGEK